MNWQPIETAPRDGSDILIFCPHYGVSRATAGKRRADEIWLLCADDVSGSYDCSGERQTNETATHWMPLPPKP